MIDQTREGYYRIPIKPEWVEQAIEEGKKIPVLKNTIRGKNGTIVGNIGEIVFSDFMGVSPFVNANYDRDFEIDGLRFEIKTKDRTVPPLDSYEASIYQKNTRQNCDVYVAISLLRNKKSGLYTHAYLIGWLGKTVYFENASFRGPEHTDFTNNHKVTEPCFNVPYSDFHRFDIIPK